MFITNIFFSIKKIHDWLTYPSKMYAEKYSKKYSQEYSKKYIEEMIGKTSPSLSSSKYAGSNPPSQTYDYNKC